MMELFLPLIEGSGNKYKKILPIKAKKAIEGKKIRTTTSDGLETQNVAGKEDWLVENQTGAKEQYLVSEKVFKEKYQLQEALDDGWGVYIPLGKVWGLEFSSSSLPKEIHGKVLYFEAAWGEKMKIQLGDFLVCPLDKSEIYRIAKKEFEQTYQKI